MCVQDMACISDLTSISRKYWIPDLY